MWRNDSSNNDTNKRNERTLQSDDISSLKKNPTSPEAKVARRKIHAFLLEEPGMFREFKKEMRASGMYTNMFVAENFCRPDVLERTGAAIMAKQQQSEPKYGSDEVTSLEKYSVLASERDDQNTERSGALFRNILRNCSNMAAASFVTTGKKEHPPSTEHRQLLNVLVYIPSPHSEEKSNSPQQEKEPLNTSDKDTLPAVELVTSSCHQDDCESVEMNKSKIRNVSVSTSSTVTEMSESENESFGETNDLESAMFDGRYEHDSSRPTPCEEVTATVDESEMVKLRSLEEQVITLECGSTLVIKEVGRATPEQPKPEKEKNDAPVEGAAEGQLLREWTAPSLEQRCSTEKVCPQSQNRQRHGTRATGFMSRRFGWRSRQTE